MDFWLSGRCGPGDFVYSYPESRWLYACDLPALASAFAQKPANSLEKSLIYILVPGKALSQAGPYTLSRVKAMMAAREICGNTWVFVEGDKEWRQVKGVKALKEALPPLPQEKPAPPRAAATEPVEVRESAPSGLAAAALAASGDGDTGGIVIGSASDFAASAASGPALGSQGFVPSVNSDSGPSLAVAAPGEDDGVQRVGADESTKAVSVLGLNLDVPSDSGPALQMDAAPAAAPPPVSPPPAAATPGAPPPVKQPPLPAAPAGATGSGPDQPSFDGITAEISADPVWLIKGNNTENVSGPFRFLEVIKLLEQGKITKNDKISKAGTNRFQKIAQQYEFNVHFEITKFTENGLQKEKILIRRRHPRVDYFANVQLIRGGATTQGACVNISAGGVLVEAPKLDLPIGETVEVKILPATITRLIHCKAQVMSKVPKIPPGFALEFTELKPEDKTAIEQFVAEALKKEQMKG